MPAQIVPASTRIRSTRAQFIESDRLLARLNWLHDHIHHANDWAEQKADFKARVREIIAIETELASRDVDFNRVTRGGTHLPEA
jgi:hypothetical protein